MKKYLTVVLLIMMLFIAGCSKDETKKENDKPRIKEEKREYFGIGYDWDCEVPLKNIKAFNNDVFITNEGELYGYSVYQIYSTTNNHCRKVDANVKFDRFIYNSILSTDYKIYYYYNAKNVLTSADDYLWNLANLTKNNQNMIFLTLPGDVASFVVEDNKVYLRESKYDNNLEKEIINLKEIHTFDDGEYYMDSSDNIIKTNKAYYEYDITNEKECKKYVDVECERGLVINKKLTKYYDEILYTDGLITIFKDEDNKIYTDSLGA